MPSNINEIYTTMKSTLNGLQFCTCLSPFVYSLLPSECTKSHEVLREFGLIAVQGHPMSSILVSMESPYVTCY